MAKPSVIPCVCRGILFLYVVLFQVEMVTSSDAYSFCINVPGTLQTSHVIKITGFISQSSAGRVTPAPWLNVILSPECSSRQSPFYLRMQVSNGITITGNTFDSGHWGEEIGGEPLTLASTGQFVLLIAIQSKGYNVTGNGVPLWTLPHRLSYTDVAKLSVRGASVSIRKIELIDQADPDQQRNTQVFYPVPLEQPVFNPTFPFWGFIPGGLQVDKAIRIKGYFPEDVPNRERTTIDLCKDRFEDSIMLHIDIRFKFSIDIRRVVRNYKKDGFWHHATEERDGPFPFNIGEEFTMLIQIQPNYYNISVNGVPYWTFNHRLPFTDVTQLVIGRDTMDILEVAYIDSSEKKEVLENLTYGNAAMGMVLYASQSFLFGICFAFFALVNHFLQTM